MNRAAAEQILEFAALDLAWLGAHVALMHRIDSVFLAGPDRFAPDAAAIRGAQRELCTAAGVTAVVGADAEESVSASDELAARGLYVETLTRLRGADALIANLSPWRGPGAEPEAAYMAGFAAALGKPVLAYMNVTSDAEADHRDRVEGWFGATPDAQGVWRDPDGCRIQDYGLPEGVMLWAEARRFYVIVTTDPLADLTGLELCLDALRLYGD